MLGVFNDYAATTFLLCRFNSKRNHSLIPLSNVYMNTETLNTFKSFQV